MENSIRILLFLLCFWMFIMAYADHKTLINLMLFKNESDDMLINSIGRIISYILWFIIITCVGIILWLALKTIENNGMVF